MENNNCTWEDGDCTRPVVYKKLGLCTTHYAAYRRAELKKKMDKKGGKKATLLQIPPEVSAAMASARTVEDWQKVSDGLAPIMSGIMSGTINASAAQVSMIRDVMNRAHGRPTGTAAEKTVAAGILILPALENNEKSVICPKCEFDALANLTNDTTRTLAVKVLKELLETLIETYKPEVAVES